MMRLRGALFIGAMLMLVGCRVGQADAPAVGPVPPPSPPEPPAVRLPAVAGTFYPADGDVLRRQVQGYLDTAPAVTVDGTIGAIISPHAGYVYSGPTAGRAYRAVRGMIFDTVVGVAGSHRVALDGYSIWWRGAYRTPLGDVPVDEELARALLRAGRHGTFDLRAHGAEHSLEVMVPFLTVALGGPYRLVPVVMGEQSPTMAAELAEALATVCRGRRVLLVASTDLSHYHPLARAKTLDGKLVDAIAAADPERFMACISGRTAEACGHGPVYAVMRAARALGYERAQVTGYDTSATASGDANRVVGYVSAVLYGTGKAKPMTSTKASTEIFSPSDDEKRALLILARRTIEAAAASKPLPPAEATTDKLGQRSGAFVTLKERGELRGCIGFIVAAKPLVETIQEMAQSAAFRDPRFPPVTAADVPKLSIEISVLSPFERITDPTKIGVGVHGIQLIRGWNSGLLLPQVATEYGWERETFLEHTCMKAGLPPKAWKDDGTEIKIFSAEIFNEAEFGLGTEKH